MRNIVRPHAMWPLLRIAALPLCLFCAIASLRAFLVYSFQVGGLHGLSAFREQYDSARAGQFVALGAFIGSQLVAGAILRRLIGRSATDSGSRAPGLLACSFGFAVLTGLVTWMMVLARVIR
jgi:hypothetical protein